MHPVHLYCRVVVPFFAIYELTISCLFSIPGTNIPGHFYPFMSCLSCELGVMLLNEDGAVICSSAPCFLRGPVASVLADSLCSPSFQCQLLQLLLCYYNVTSHIGLVCISLVTMLPSCDISHRFGMHGPGYHVTIM